jgi:hypothetical protein
MAGLVTARWDYVFAGAVGVVVCMVLPLVLPFAALGLWIGLLLQPSTPAYVAVWILLGLPFLVLGMGGGEAPTYFCVKWVPRQ